MKVLRSSSAPGPDDTFFDVVVDQPHGLHERMHRGRPGELPALLAQILGQRGRRRGRRGGLRLGQVGRVRLVTPDEGGQRSVPVHEFPSPAGVADHRLDLAPVAHDAGILQEALDVLLGEAGNGAEVEAGEGGAEVLPLDQDGAPAQPGLEALQAQLLEQAAIVADREAPLGVVIGQELRRGAAPGAARLAVRSGHRRCHPAAASRNLSRSSAVPGAISMICALTMFSATKGSAFTRLSRSSSDVLCARTAPPSPGWMLPAVRNTSSAKPRVIHSSWPLMCWPAALLLPENHSSTTNI